MFVCVCLCLSVCLSVSVCLCLSDITVSECALKIACVYILVRFSHVCVVLWFFVVVIVIVLVCVFICFVCGGHVSQCDSVPVVCVLFVFMFFCVSFKLCVCVFSLFVCVSVRVCVWVLYAEEEHTV